MSSKIRWLEKDGSFNYQNFYYSILDIIEDCMDMEWSNSLLQFHNRYVESGTHALSNTRALTVLSLVMKMDVRIQTPRMLQLRRVVAHPVPSLQDCMHKDKNTPRKRLALRITITMLMTPMLTAPTSTINLQWQRQRHWPEHSHHRNPHSRLLSSIFQPALKCFNWLYQHLFIHKEPEWIYHNSFWYWNIRRITTNSDVVGLAWAWPGPGPSSIFALILVLR